MNFLPHKADRVALLHIRFTYVVHPSHWLAQNLTVAGHNTSTTPWQDPRKKRNASARQSRRLHLLFTVKIRT